MQSLQRSRQTRYHLRILVMVSNRKRVPYSKAIEQLADDKGELYSVAKGFPSTYSLLRKINIL